MNQSRTNLLITSLITLLVVIFPSLMPSIHAAKSMPNYAFTVVIDAGHGGKDPGAQDNGVTEKEINLQVALKLAEYIRKNLKDANVILTRDKDEYLTLQQRADKANKANGNLFISLHVNSADISNPKRTSAAGTSVHVLGQSKDKKNMDVVRRENSVIKLEKNYSERYQGFNPDSDESYIIFEMMQKRFQEQSVDLARDIQQQLKNIAGRKDRGVTQEPFWVLWATSMPSVLVELDFICNPNSAKFIASKQGQNRIAKALFNAVRDFYNREKALTQQPVRANDDETDTSDGNTYIGDGYAILGQPAHAERKITDNKGRNLTTSNHRQTGAKRRSSAGRDTSASQTREQAEVRIRTHAEPTALTGKPSKSTGKQAESTSNAPKPSTATSNRKAAKQKSSVSTESPKTNKAPSKSPKSNRKRGMKAVVVTVPDNSKTPGTTVSTKTIDNQNAPSSPAKPSKKDKSKKHQSTSSSGAQPVKTTADSTQTPTQKESNTPNQTHSKKPKLNKATH